VSRPISSTSPPAALAQRVRHLVQGASRARAGGKPAAGERAGGKRAEAHETSGGASWVRSLSMGCGREVGIE
jgi:hypothetical protein